MATVRDPVNLTLESLVEFTRTGVAIDMDRLENGGGDFAQPGVFVPALFNDTPYLTYGSCILNNPQVSIQNKKNCNSCAANSNALVPDWKALLDGDIYLNEKTCNYEIVKECFQIKKDGRKIKKEPIVGYPSEELIGKFKELAISQMLKEFGKAETATVVMYVPDGFGISTQEELNKPNANTDYFNDLLKNANKTNPGSLVDAILIGGPPNDPETRRKIPSPIKGFTRFVQDVDVVQELKRFTTHQIYVNISDSVPTKILFSIETELMELVPQLLVSNPSIPLELYTQSGQEVTITGKDYDTIFNRVSNSLSRAAGFVDNLVVETDSIFYVRVDETGENDVPIALDTRIYKQKLKEFKRSLNYAIKKTLGIRIRELEKVIISFDSGQSLEETEDEELLYTDALGKPIPTPPKIRIKNIIANKFGCPEVVVYDRDDINYRNKQDINEIFDSMKDSTLNGYLASMPEMLIYLEGKEEADWISYILKYTYPGLIVKDRLINAGDELSKCINRKSINGLVNDLIMDLVEFPNVFLNSVTDKVCNTKEEVLEEENNINETRKQIREQLVRLRNQSELLDKSIGYNYATAVDPETGNLNLTEDEKRILGFSTTKDGIIVSELNGRMSSILNGKDAYGVLQNLASGLKSGRTESNLSSYSKTSLEYLAQLKSSNDYKKLEKTVKDYEKSLRTTKGIPYGDSSVAPTVKTFDTEAVDKAKKELEAINRATELVKELQSTTKKEIIKDKFLSTTTKSLISAKASTSNKPLVNLIIQLILGAVAGEDSNIGAVLSQQVSVDTLGATKLRKSGKKGTRARKMPLIENAGDNKLASLLNNLNSGGGWCAWVAMIQEAAQCILKGLNLGDIKSAIVKAALKKLTPFEWQKMFRNMPPEIRNRISNTITKAMPDLIGVLFPWQDNLGTGNFRPDLALEDARQQILTKSIFVQGATPLPPPPPAEIPLPPYTVPVINFDVAKYDIKKPAEEQKITDFLQFIDTYFNKNGSSEYPVKITISVFGHTSTTAKNSTNEKLSENRMKSVIDLLENKNVFDPKYGNLTITGKYFGESVPLILSDENSPTKVKDEYENDANRRAEIFLSFDPVSQDGIVKLPSISQAAIASIIKAQNEYNKVYQKNATVYSKQANDDVKAMKELTESNASIGTTVDAVLNNPNLAEKEGSYYYTGSEEYPDTIYPGSDIKVDDNGNLLLSSDQGYLKDYLSSGYGEDGLILYSDPNDSTGALYVTPPAPKDNTSVQGGSSGVLPTTPSTAVPDNVGLTKQDIAYNVLLSESQFYQDGILNMTVEQQQKKMQELMRLSDNELIDRGAQARYREMRQDFINKRLAAGAGAKFTGAVGEITSEAFDLIIDTILDLVGVDVLLDELNNLPGIGIVKKIVRDLNCIIPPMPFIKPTIEEYIKGLRFDLCYIGQKGYKATARMVPPPLLYGRPGYPLYAKGWGERAREILILIGLKAADMLLDLLTQILIKALVKVIETILDMACSLVAEAAANLASMAVRNSDFLSKLKNAICPDSDITDEAFGDGLEGVLKALYPAAAPDNSCAASLTGPELADFIDSIVVTLSYGQLYDLVLGNASEEALRMVSAIATAKGGCISQIFSDTTNVLNYFAGLGKLIGAQDVFSQFPAGVNLTSSASICPPNTFQKLKDLRQSLLENKGLTPEQVQEQLDFLQNEAVKKLEDLSKLLKDGPFSSLEDLITSDQECTFNGIMGQDPYDKIIEDNSIESILVPIEMSVMRDLIGNDGALNMILADTNGADVKLHRSRVRDFGNSIGQTNNLPHEYYSDNTIRQSYIEKNDLVVVNDKTKRLDQYGRIMPLAKTDKGPVGGFGPTVGGHLMNKLQTTRVGLAQYGEGSDLTKIKQDIIEFKTNRMDITAITKRNILLEFNRNLFIARRDRIAKFCIATGFIDAETAAQYMIKPPSQGTYDYTDHIKYYFDYTKRKAVFLDMINASSRVFTVTKVDFPDYSPEKRVERCLGQPKNPELREFSYSGDRVGMGYFMKEKIKNAYNRGDQEVEFSTGKGLGIALGILGGVLLLALTGGLAAGAIAAAGAVATTQVAVGTAITTAGNVSAAIAAANAAAAVASTSAIVAGGAGTVAAAGGVAAIAAGFSVDPITSTDISAGRKPVKTLKFNREMMEYYLECWYAYDTEAEGIDDEERRKHYKPFILKEGYVSPDTPSKTIPLIDSSELSFTYITYPKMYGGVLGSGKGKLSMPEYAFDLKYDLNIEDENGNLIPSFKNNYKVTLIEKYNPFGDQKLNSDQSRNLKDYYNLIMSSPNTKDQVGEDSSDLEGYPGISVGSGDRTIIKFDKIINSSPESDVLKRSEDLLSYSPASDIQYSFESEALLRFLQEKLNQSDILSSVINNFSNSITRNKINNLFDFINDGFVKRITSTIGEGDGNSEIYEFDEVEVQNYEDYTTEKSISQVKKIKVPKAFRFGYDPELSPILHILDPSKYGGSEDNPPYYIEPPTYQGWLGLAQKMFPETDGCSPSRKYISSLEELRKEYESIKNIYAGDERLGFDPLCTKEAPYNQIFETSVVTQMEIAIRATIRTYLLEQMLRISPILSTFQANDNNFDELFYIYLSDTILNEIKTIDMKRPFPERGPKIAVSEDGKIDLLREIERRYTYFYGFLEQVGFSIIKRIEANQLSKETLGPTQQEALQNIENAIQNYYLDYDGTEAVLSDESIAAQTVMNRMINGIISRKVNGPVGLGGSSFDKITAKKIKKAAIYKALKDTEQDARILFSIFVKEEFIKLSKVITEKFEPSVEGLDLLFLSSGKYMNGAVTKIYDDYGNILGYEGPYDVMSDPGSQDSFNIDLNKFTVQTDSGEFVNKVIPISTDPIQAQKDIEVNSKESWPFVLERYITTDEPTVGKIKDQIIYDSIVNRDPKLFGNINFNDWDTYIKELSQNNQNFTGKISDFWGRTEGKSGWRWGVRLSLVFAPDSQYYEIFKDIIEKMPVDVINKQKAFKLVNNDKEPDKYIILIPLCFGELEIPDQDISLFSLDQFDLPCTIMELIKTTDFRLVTKYLFPQKRYLSLMSIYTANSFFDSIGNAGKPSEGGDRWTIPGGRRNSSFRKWDKGNIFYDPQKIGNDSANVMMNTFMALYRAKANFASQTRNTNRKTLPDVKELLLSLLPDPIIPDIPWFQRKNMIPRPYDMFGEECPDNTQTDVDEGEY